MSATMVKKTFAVPHLALWPSADVLARMVAADESAARELVQRNLPALTLIAKGPCIACSHPANGLDIFAAHTGVPPVIAIPLCDACKDHPEYAEVARQRQLAIYDREAALGPPESRAARPTVH